MFVVITNIYSTNDKTFIPNYVFSVVGVIIKKYLQCPLKADSTCAIVEGTTKYYLEKASPGDWRL